MMLTGCIVYASTSLPGKPPENHNMKIKGFDGPLQSHLLSYMNDMPDHWPPSLSVTSEPSVPPPPGK